MINRELINPQSIVVVGGSNNVHKPGGRLVRNLLDGKYKGELYVVNAKEDDVQGLKSYHSVHDIPETELAIISIPGPACPEAVDVLAKQKNVKAFIVISAGFGEETHEGAILEEQMLKIHQYAIMSAPTLSQYAAIVALRECDKEVQKMVEEYNMRRRMLVDGFNRIGLTCFNPEGAFYMFPCIRSTGMTSEEFCEMLLQEEKVAVVPGSAFGESGEGFVRV